MRRTWLIFSSGKDSADLWLDAKQGKESGRNTTTFKALRISGAGQIKTHVGDRGHAFKDVVLIAPVNKVSGGGCVARVTVLGRIFPNHYQPIRIFIREWTQQHGVHNAEDSCVRADSQRQGDDSN